MCYDSFNNYKKSSIGELGGKKFVVLFLVKGLIKDEHHHFQAKRISNFLFNAMATFSSVESLISSAWFSIREIAVF